MKPEVFTLEWINRFLFRIARQTAEPFIFLYERWLQVDPEIPANTENQHRRTRLILGLPAVCLAMASAIIGIIPSSWQAGIKRRYSEQLEQSDTHPTPSALMRLGQRILSDDRIFNSTDRYQLALCLATYESPEDSLGSDRIFEQLAPENTQGLIQAHRKRALDSARILGDRPIDPIKLRALGWHVQQSLGLEDPTIQRLRSDYYLATGQYDQASSELAKLADSDPGVWFTHAEIQLARGNLNAARSSLARASEIFGRQVSQNPADNESRIRYATALGRLGEFDAAIDSMTTGWRLTSDARFAAGIGQVYLMKYQKQRNLQGPIQQQWNALEQAMRWTPENPQVYEAFSQLCADRNAAPLHEAFLEKIDEMMEQTEHRSKLLFAKSNLKLADSDIDGATEILSAILQNDADFHPALNNLAWILMDRDNASEQDLQTAETYARRAVELEPQSGSYRDTLGAVFIKQKRWTEAIAEFEQSLRDSKRPIPTLEKIARAYQELGQVELAQQYRLRIDKLKSDLSNGKLFQDAGVK